MLHLSLPTIQKARLARDARFDGLFYVGVKSTGIFCRPICKARMPLEKNVTYYPSAIAAMSEGFRPCLMCRPDSAPGSCAWKGVETTVERGVKLLSANLSLSIAQIANKLGISTRYFTKLFEQHLQVSPKRYQLLSRLLFAKQLLHESALPIEQVAHACGFSAAKPLQHHMKLNTGLTPSQIRRERKVNQPVKAKTPSDQKMKAQLHDEFSAKLTKQAPPALSRQIRVQSEYDSQYDSQYDGKAEAPFVQSTQTTDVKVFLSYRPPYQWQHIRDFFKLREIQSNERIDSDSISKVLNLGGGQVFFKAQHQSEKHRFEVLFSITNLALLKDSIAALKKMLDLNSEPLAIYDSLQQAGLPPSYILNGLRLPGIVDRFEAGCRAIVGQQVTVKAAIGQLNLLQDTLGNAGTLEGAQQTNRTGELDTKQRSRPLRSFVSPEQVAQADLSFLKMPNARKATLKALAQFMLQNPQANVDEWLQIKGIGPWTVNYVNMRNSDSPDIFLDSDLVIRNQLKKLAEEQVYVREELAAPWRTYLTLSLWNLSSGTTKPPSYSGPNEKQHPK